jgi:voltage-gated potassium channel
MNIKQEVRGIIEESESVPGKIFSYLIQALIILSLITFSLDTLPDLSVPIKKVLSAVEVITVGIFTIEYLLRIWVVEKRLRFIFSFMGLIDLMAILPFYISTGLDLRSLRVFRLLRLVRILKLVKYNKAIKRFEKALVMAKEELVLIGFVILALLFLSAVGIYYFENAAQPDSFKSVFHSLWWAVVTLTTVGYGDVIPITIGGRVFTFFVLIIGLGIVAVPTGIIASALSKVTGEEGK